MVARAVAEDLPDGDPTGAAVGPRQASASIVARQPGTIAGLCTVELVLDEVSNRLGTGKALAVLALDDGQRAATGTVLGELSGPAGTLLAAERTVLNILTHLSGVATMTAVFVEAVAGTGAVVRDTRKTLPGLRAAEKYAVRCGGGANHRMSLSDAILVKDNHVGALGGVKAAVEAARLQAQAQAERRNGWDSSVALGYTGLFPSFGYPNRSGRRLQGSRTHLKRPLPCFEQISCLPHVSRSRSDRSAPATSSWQP